MSTNGGIVIPIEVSNAIEFLRGRRKLIYAEQEFERCFDAELVKSLAAETHKVFMSTNECWKFSDGSAVWKSANKRDHWIAQRRSGEYVQDDGHRMRYFETRDAAVEALKELEEGKE